MSGDIEGMGVVKQYLLGELTDQERERFEVLIMSDTELFNEMLLAEEDLVEAYVNSAMSRNERQRFELSYMSTVEGREQVSFARALGKYVKSRAADTAPSAKRGKAHQPILSRATWFSQLAGSPYLRGAAAAIIVIGIGLGIWRVFLYQSDVTKGLGMLAYAYREQRPSEARISGFNYAPAANTRGDEDKVDRVARDRAERILIDAVFEHSGPTTHHALGKFYLANRELDKAMAQFDDALETDANNAQIHSDYGAALLEEGMSLATDPDGRRIEAFTESLAHLNRALAINPNLREALFNRGIVHEQLRLPERAKDDWESYLRKDSTSPWADEAREHLTRIGERRRQLDEGEHDLADEFLNAYRAADTERAWALLSRNRERLTTKLLAEYRKGSGNSSVAADRTPLHALAYAGQIDLQRVGDRYITDLAQYYLTTTPEKLEAASEADKLFRRAGEKYAKSQLDDAIDLYTQAQRLQSRIGDLCEARVGAYWLGLTYLESTRTDQSASLFGSLARDCEADGYRWLQARALFYMSAVEFNRSEYSKAIASAERARDEAEKINDLSCVLSAASALIEYNRLLGNKLECFREISRGLPIQQPSGIGPMSLGRYYGIAAMTFNTFGFHDAAIDYQLEAVRYAFEVGDFASLSVAHAHLGLMYGKLKNFDEAFKNVGLAYSQAEAHAAEVVGQEKMAYAALQTGNLHREQGNFASALANYDRSIELYLGLNFPTHLYQAYKGRLVCTIEQTDIVSAQQQLADILKLMEQHRANIFEEENRNNFFDIEQSVYDLGINFEYSRRNDPLKAYEYAEASRARSLLDSITAGAPVTSERKGRDPLMRFVTEPYTLGQIQARIPEGAHLAEYSVLDDRLLIFIISRAAFQAVEVKISRVDLTNKVKLYCSSVEALSNENHETAARLSGELHELLIAPVEPLLDGSNRLIMVPDKELNRMPWDALISAGGDYLIENYLVTAAPSATLFAMCTDLANEKAVAAPEHAMSVGDPSFDRLEFKKLDRLPDALGEAEAIAKLYPSSSRLLGPAARELAVRDELKVADVAHFAGHCVVNERSPMRSSLVLAREPAGNRDPAIDGKLQTGEICGLKLPRLRLAVLSACQTGVERYYRGEGMIGMARAFLIARVPVVVASLWPVDSKATRELMIRFHQYRKRDGLPTAEALRLAKLYLLHGRVEHDSSPVYWAAFQVIGGNARY